MRRTIMRVCVAVVLMTMTFPNGTSHAAEDVTRVGLYFDEGRYNRYFQETLSFKLLAQRMAKIDQIELVEKFPEKSSFVKDEFVVGSPDGDRPVLWGQRRAKPFLAILGRKLGCDLGVRVRFSSMESRRYAEWIFGTTMTDVQTGIRLLDTTFSEVSQKPGIEIVVNQILAAQHRQKQLHQGKDLFVCSVDVEGIDMPPTYNTRCEGLARLLETTLMRLDRIATISPACLAGFQDGFHDGSLTYFDRTHRDWPEVKELSAEVKSRVRKVHVTVRPAETEGQFVVDMQIAPLGENPGQLSFPPTEFDLLGMAEMLAKATAKHLEVSDELTPVSRNDLAKRFLWEYLSSLSTSRHYGLAGAGPIGEIVLALSDDPNLWTPFLAIASSNASLHAMSRRWHWVGPILDRLLEQTEMRILHESDTKYAYTKKAKWYGFFHPNLHASRTIVMPDSHPFMIQSLQNGALGTQYMEIERFDIRMSGPTLKHTIGASLWRSEDEKLLEQFEPLRLAYRRLFTDRIVPCIFEAAAERSDHARLTAWMNYCDHYLPALSVTSEEYLSLRIPLVERWLERVERDGVPDHSPEVDWTRDFHEVLYRLIHRQRQFEFAEKEISECPRAWQFDPEDQKTLLDLFVKMIEHPEPAIRFAGRLGLVVQGLRSSDEPLPDEEIQQWLDTLWEHLDASLDAKSINPPASRNVCYHLGLDMAFLMPNEERRTRMLSKLVDKMLTRGDVSWPVLLCTFVTIPDERVTASHKGPIDTLFAERPKSSLSWRPGAFSVAERVSAMLATADEKGKPPTILTDPARFKTRFTMAENLLRNEPREKASSTSTLVSAERLWDLDLDRPGKATYPQYDVHTLCQATDGTVYVLRVNSTGEKPYPVKDETIHSTIIHQIDPTNGTAKIVDRADWSSGTRHYHNAGLGVRDTTLYGGQRRSFGVDGDILWVSDLYHSRVRLFNRKTKEVDWFDKETIQSDRKFMAVTMLDGVLFVATEKHPYVSDRYDRLLWRYDVKTKEAKTIATTLNAKPKNVLEKNKLFLFGPRDMVPDPEKHRIMLFERSKRQWYTLDIATNAFTLLRYFPGAPERVWAVVTVWTGPLHHRKIIQAKLDKDSYWHLYEFDVDTHEYKPIVAKPTTLQPPYVRYAGSIWSGRPFCRIASLGKPNEKYDTQLDGFNPPYEKSKDRYFNQVDHLKHRIIPLDVPAKDPKNKRLLVSNGHAVWLLDVVDRVE